MTKFRFNPRPETWTTVKLNVPTEEGMSPQTFRARFVVLPDGERRALAEDPKKALETIWIGWEDIEDIEGTPVPFSSAARDQFLEHDYIVLGVAAAYQRATAGIETKN